jgi:hypothetical protein
MVEGLTVVATSDVEESWFLGGLPPQKVRRHDGGPHGNPIASLQALRSSTVTQQQWRCSLTEVHWFHGIQCRRKVETEEQTVGGAGISSMINFTKQNGMKVVKDCSMS